MSNENKKKLPDPPEIEAPEEKEEIEAPKQLPEIPAPNEKEITAHSQIKQDKQSFPKKTLLLIIFLGALTTALITLAVFLARQPGQPEEIIQTINPVPQTVLSISSVPQFLQESQTYEAEIFIETGTNRVNKAQIELSFDPSVLTVEDIVPGSFFQNPQILLKNIDQEDGRITLALGLLKTEPAVSGNGILATLRFIPLITTESISTQINFLPKTDVSQEQTATSVLKQSIGAFFTLEPQIPISTSSPTIVPTIIIDNFPTPADEGV